jgi:hypothetical protein
MPVWMLRTKLWTEVLGWLHTYSSGSSGIVTCPRQRLYTDSFSAMPPIHHRDPGLIGLLGDPISHPYYGIIVDGLHLHPNTVRIAYKACKEGCILVTDGG